MSDSKAISGKLGDNVRRFLRKQESSIIIATILYMAFVSIVNPVFISSNNLFNILKTMGYTLITVVGMCLVLITGGLDLSVGSTLALGGVITGMACRAEIPVIISIFLGILTGLLIGTINGFIIVNAKIPPLIVTLGMQYIVRGMVSVLTQGVPIYPLPAALKAIDRAKLLGLPLVVVVALLIAFIGHTVLARTPFGRSVFALGGNEDAARISGINCRKTKMSVYMITGLLASLAGVFMASRLGSAEAAVGSGYEMTTICGAIIGGVSTFGGVGTVLGALIGAFFMEVLTNSLTLMRVSVYWQNVVVGVVLIVAVLLDQYKRDLIRRSALRGKN